VVAADTRQRGFSIEEEEAAKKYGYSSEEIEGDFDSEEEEKHTKRSSKSKKKRGDCDVQETNPHRHDGGGSGGDTKNKSALLVKQYDFDTLSVKEINNLWRQAAVITTYPKPDSWIAHLNSMSIATSLSSSSPSDSLTT
jgi:hypothetical protein